MNQPLLFSFRRCPYAIRARLALFFTEQSYTKIEVDFKDKPQQMLQLSPKGTVPVLQLTDGTVLEESLDIMLWALQLNDPQQLLPCGEKLDEQLSLIETNDQQFKPWLDRYKYADRHPEQSPQYYRERGEKHLKTLEQRLQQSRFLNGDKPQLCDIALMPFVRQFAHVDKKWFNSSDYTNLQQWLEYWLQSRAFMQIMAKASL